MMWLRRFWNWLTGKEQEESRGTKKLKEFNKVMDKVDAEKEPKFWIRKSGKKKGDKIYPVRCANCNKNSSEHDSSSSE